MHMGMIAGQQQGLQGPMPGGQLATIPGVGGVPPVPGGIAMKGPQQPSQPAQAPQQVNGWTVLGKSRPLGMGSPSDVGKEGRVGWWEGCCVLFFFLDVIWV